MRVETYNLTLMFSNGDEKVLKNISRVALLHYIDYYLGQSNFVGYDYILNELERSNNWLART